MSRGVLAGAALAVLAACAAFTALDRATSAPQDRRMSEYAEFGEALVHGIAARSAVVSYRMPLATVLASRLQFHSSLTPASAGAAYWVLTCVLVFALCALLHPWGGVFAAAAVASLLHGATDFRFYPDSGYAFLVLLCACVLAWRARAPSPRKTVLLALSFGATLLYRSPLALFPPLLALYEWGTEHRFSRKSARGHLLVLCVVPYLLLLPWIALNWTAHRRFVPFEHRAASVNIVSGALGLVENVEGDMSTLVGSAVDLSDGGAVLGWAGREVARHPLRYARAVARRAAYALAPHPWLALLALAALVVFRARREFRAVGLLAAYYLAIHCLFTVETRYFWPLWPLLAALAASLIGTLKPKARLDPAAPEHRLACGATIACVAVVFLAVLLTELTIAGYAFAARGGGEVPEAALTRALTRYPEDPWLLTERGTSRLERGAPEGAADDFARAARAEPGEPASLLKLAAARARAGRPFMILHWSDADRDSGLAYDAAILKALALIQLGRAKEAEKLLRAALAAYQERNSVVRGAQGELGRGIQEKLRGSDAGFVARCLQLQGGRPERERRELARLLAALLPQSGRVLIAEAESAVKSGRRTEALALLSEAEARSPNPEEKRRVAALYRELREFTRAGKALDSLPESAALWIDRGETAAGQGDRDEALRDLARAEALPLSAGERRRVVSLYGSLKEYGKVSAALDEYARRHPGSAGPWIERAELAAWTGDKDGARSALKRAEGLAFDDEERLRLAGLRRRTLDTRAARELLKPLIAASDRRAGAMLELAEIEAADGRRAEESSALAAAEKLSPSPVELRRAAALYREAGDRRRAASILSALIAARPDDAGLRLDLAELSSGRESLDAVAKALALKPDAAERRRAAVLYLRLREPAKARAVLDALGPGGSSEPALWLEQAELAAELGEKTRAREALAKAVGPASSAEERRRAAALYRTLGDDARARELLAALAAASPRDAGLLLEQAELAAGAGSRGRALELLAKTAALSPGESEARRAAALYSSLDEYAKAVALLEPVLRARPGDAALRVELSAAYRRLGQPLRASKTLEPLAAAGSAAILLERADVSAALGRPDEARRDLLAAEAAPPADVAQLLRVVHSYQALKDYGRAVAVLTPLIQKKASAALLCDRGLNLHLAGNSDAAISDLKRAVELAPDYLPSYLTLGAVYESLGRATDARALYDRALARPRKPENEALRALIK